MDNRIFNVNGNAQELLSDALQLAFLQAGHDFKAKAFKVDKKKGLILLWSDEGTKFPVPLDAHAVLPIVTAWLEGDEAKTIECEGWDADADHDGNNERGWRVYVEDWGHVGDCSYAICAVKPAYMWFGK